MNAKSVTPASQAGVLVSGSFFGMFMLSALPALLSNAVEDFGRIEPSLDETTIKARSEG